MVLQWSKLQHIEVREAVLCWGRASEAASSLAPAVVEAAEVPGRAGQAKGEAPVRWEEQGITFSGVRVLVRTSCESAPGSGGAATIYSW